MSAKRRRFLEAFCEQGGLPYLWDGKGFTPLECEKFKLSAPPYNGRDCSGAITYALHRAGGPDLRGTYNCAKMWYEWQLVDTDGSESEPGDCFFYGHDHEDKPAHVMVGVYRSREGIWLVAGSAGGDRTTTTLARAMDQGARFQYWQSHLFMGDFRGVRRIAWFETD